MPLPWLSRIPGYLNLIRTCDLDEIVWRSQAAIGRLDLRMESSEELGLDPEYSFSYTDSGATVRRALRALAIAKTGAAIDYGCGKAGAVIQLARWFERADGLDICESLVTVGRENLRRMGVNNARLIVGDATTFSDIDGYGFFFLSSPFPCAVVEQVVDQIAASMARCPRTITVMYINPIGSGRFEKAGFRQIGKVLPLRGQEDWRTVLLFSRSPR